MNTDLAQFSQADIHGFRLAGGACPRAAVGPTRRPATRNDDVHASAPQAEADRYRYVHSRLRHSRRKRRQHRAPNHLFDRLVEVWVARARRDRVIDHTPAAVDRKPEDRPPFFAALASGVGITLVAFEPGAQQRAVTSARLRRGLRGWDRGRRHRGLRWRHRGGCIGILRLRDRDEGLGGLRLFLTPQDRLWRLLGDVLWRRRGWGRRRLGDGDGSLWFRWGRFRWGGGSGGGGSAATTGGSGGGGTTCGVGSGGGGTGSAIGGGDSSGAGTASCFGGAGSKTTSMPPLATGNGGDGVVERNSASAARQAACPASDSAKGSLMPLTSARPPRRSETLSRTRPH